MYFSVFFSCTFDYLSRYQELGVVNTIAKILLLLFFVIAVIGIGILVKLLEVDFTISSIFPISAFGYWILFVASVLYNVSSLLGFGTL